MSALDPARKVLSRDAAIAWRRDTRGRVVFTNGVFDLLHSGHVDLLCAARSRGDALIVGLNSDDSVRRLKGPARPIRSTAERAQVVAALECVDAVTVFEEDTPEQLIRALRPDVLVKGGDYTVESMVGARDVVSWGGEALILPLTPGQSTTRIIERLRDRG